MKVFNITDFGAVADSVTDNAAAIQKAIDECSAAGGGVVSVPRNATFMTGPFDLKSFVDFHVESGARIVANPDESVYTRSAFRQNQGEGSIWIGGEHADKVTMSGEGTIDGNGIAFMGPEEKAAFVLKEFTTFDRRPHVLTVIGFTSLTIRDLTFKNSAYWCLHLIGCSHVRIHNVRIDNHLKIRNSDGIDLDHTRDVEISNCHIASGDDCICFKTRREYAEYGPTENITVSDCVMTSTSCSVKLGSENMDAIRNVVVRNCVIRASNRGIGIQNRDEGVVENVSFEDIHVEGRLFDDVWWGKAEPIYVTAYKRKASSGKDANVRFAPGQTVGNVGAVRNISFSNIDCQSENGIFVGGEDGKVKDIRFANVNVVVEKATGYAGGSYDLRPSDTVGILAAGTYGFMLMNAAAIEIRHSAVKWGKALAAHHRGALNASHVNGLLLESFTGESANDAFESVSCDQCTNVTIK
jgi:polygalacturonase